MATSKPSKTNNPTGIGGFRDNPQNRSSGHWSKEDSIPNQLNRFMRMGAKELAQWAKDNEETMTVAQGIALNILNRSLHNLSDAKEVIDRTSGKAKETIEQTIIEKPIPLEDLDFELR